MSRRRTTAAATAALLGTAWAAAVAAQPATPDAPVPASTLEMTSWALHSNPANLSFTRGFFTGLVLRAIENSGEAPSAGWVMGGGFGSGLGGALGVDSVRGELPHVRFSMGLAAGSERVSLGFAWRRWWSPERVGFGNFRSADLFATTRATRWLAVSAGVSNLGERRLASLGTDRQYRFGLGLREPRGRVELDLSWQSTLRPATRGGRPTAPPLASATLSATIVPGASIWASAQATTRDRVEPSSVSFGIRIGLGPSSFRTGASVGMAPGAEAAWTSILGVDIAVPAPADVLPDRDRLLRIPLGTEIAEVSAVSLLGRSGALQTDLLVTLDQIRRDRRIGGVFIETAGLTSGTAQLEELRGALLGLRDAGLIVAVHLHDATVRDLYLATAADFVTISPLAATLDAGISTNRFYLASLLDTFGVEAQFVRIGDFKSGPERFTRTGPSDAAVLSLDAYLDDVWAELRSGLLDGSALDGDALDAALLAVPLFPEWLQRNGFVDAVAHLDDAQEALESHFDRRFSFASDYASAVGRGAEWFPGHRVAVIHIEGSIVSGAGGLNFLTGTVSTGAADIEESCRSILRDGAVDGVIVRINSPGGSATASDDMLRALRRLAETLPVVVSMGNVAASGGYYAASIGTEIHAARSTLTGSIGIYAGTFAIEELLGAFGVARVFSDRGGPSGFFNGRRWDAEREAAVMRSITAAYDVFVGHVATSRDMTTEAVDAAAQGRIWSGADALDAGLVDDLGGFNAALRSLRATLDVPERAAIEIEHYPERRGFALLGALLGADAAATMEGGDASGRWLREQLGTSGVLRAVVALIESSEGTLQARLEWELEGL